MTIHEITMAEANEFTLDYLQAGLVPHLISSPGVGKSSLAREIAKENNLLLIDVRLSQADPTDLNGFPFILDKTAKRVKAGYVPMDIFPVEGDELPINPKTGEQYAGWLLLLDEFNSAPRAVQAAAYKLVLDRMVGMHKLHKACACMAAGNRIDDHAIVNELSTALQSRLVHLVIKVCQKTWDIWAVKNGIDHRVRSYINFESKMLHNFSPTHNDLTYPCPRTWEFLSKVVSNWARRGVNDIPKRKLPVLAGIVGDAAARNFMTYTQVYDKIPTFDQIMADPDNVPFGDDPSMQYALSGMLADKMDTQNGDVLVRFIRRLEIDFQLITLRSAIRRLPALQVNQGVKDWFRVNNQELKPVM